MNNRQDNFENRVILESELVNYYNTNGDIYQMSLDDYTDRCLTLSDVASEYGKDIDFENRKLLQIIIKERFERLSDMQRKIAELKYLEDKSVREIASNVDRAISTVQFHINKINDIIRSI